MARDTLQYDKMVEHALRGVVRQALSAVITQGLPGNHHFYLTFRTTYPGVDIAQRLREKYPQEMTIVLQHEFWGLEVADDYFIVNLTFSDIPERLKVPFAALVSFVDPSVKFGLQFQGDSTPGTAMDLTNPAAGQAAPAKEPPTLTLASSTSPTVKPVPAKEPTARLKDDAKPSLQATKESAVKDPASPAPDDDTAPAAKKDPEKVVSLDSFRKK